MRNNTHNDAANIVACSPFISIWLYSLFFFCSSLALFIGTHFIWFYDRKCCSFVSRCVIKSMHKETKQSTWMQCTHEWRHNHVKYDRIDEMVNGVSGLTVHGAFAFHFPRVRMNRISHALAFVESSCTFCTDARCHPKYRCGRSVLCMDIFRIIFSIHESISFIVTLIYLYECACAKRSRRIRYHCHRIYRKCLILNAGLKILARSLSCHCFAEHAMWCRRCLVH